MESAADLLETVRAGGLLPPGSPVVAMLSGGRDSVCLLDLAVRLAGRGHVHALHVNYGLRPEADGDERHCASLCEALGVPLEVERAGELPAGNVQARAREVRYAAAERLAAAHGAPIATGHTASDQVETVLYRLAASPGRRALLGMPATEGRLVRPLLGVTREQTAAHCRARGLEWREDASNDDPVYARARARHGLLPALRSLHPAAERNVLRTVELLRDEADALDAVVEKEVGGADRIALAALAELPRGLRRLVVRRLAEEAAGKPVPAAASRVDELLALARGPGTAALDLEGGVRALVEDGMLRFGATPRPPRGRRGPALAARGAIAPR